MAGLPIQVGQVVAGKYRIEAAIGRGGMGAVFRATHVQLLQPVALKVLLPGVVHDLPDAVQRFLREARAAARLGSEHVAKVLDVDAEGATPYMAMEYLEGTDLAKQLKERGRFSVADALAYTLDVCAALSEAHALGIVHRDLKPQNMFLTRRVDGRPIVKVLDFGISKVTAVGTEDGEGTDLTGTQMVLGSPRYMSPEQMRATKHVDARTDIWALGVCLYEFLTGSVPFEAPTQFELGAKVLTASPDPPSSKNRDVPPDLDRAVLRCLAKDPAQRFSSIVELARLLASFTSAAPTTTNRHVPSGEVPVPLPVPATMSLTPAHGPFLGITPSRPSSPFFSSVPPPSGPASSVPYGLAPASQPPGVQTNATWSDSPTEVKAAQSRRVVLGAVVVAAVLALAVIGRVVATSSTHAGAAAPPATQPPATQPAATQPFASAASVTAPTAVVVASSIPDSPTAAPIATAGPVATVAPQPAAAKPPSSPKKPPPASHPALPNER